MDNCKNIRKLVDKEGATKSYEKINKYIDDLISNKSKSEAIKEIKSLICQFEGILNKANAYAVMAIVYALIICLISIVDDLSDILVYLLLIVTVVIVFVGILSQKILKTDYKDAFILKALNFKLDELIEESKHIETESKSDNKQETKGKKKSKKKGKK